MTCLFRERILIVPLFLCVLASVPLSLRAQEDGTSGPPKVLFIEREFTKPGKGGALHEKSEAAFVQVLEAAKAKPHYLAMDAMTGPSRALFMSGYPSFAAWEAENKSVYGDSALTAALDHANVVDGDLLSATDSSAWLRRDELSFQQPGNLTGVRYFEISQYVVKPGHGKQWSDLVKLVTAAYQKSLPSASWVVYSEVYGAGTGNGFLVIWPYKSLAEIDSNFAARKAFREALGPEGLTKFDELLADCIESEQTNLFSFNPKMSRPPEEWIKSEPTYWKPKPAAMTPAKKPAAKPAAAQ